nr:ATP-binding protein [uncultured Thiodictyon sp.]
MVIDASGVRFVDPFGLTLLGASFQELSDWGQRVIVCGLSSDVGGYLQRMDLFTGVELRDCAPVRTRRHNRQDALVELTCIVDKNAASDAAGRLTSALIGAVPGIDRNEAPDLMTGRTQADRLGMPIQYVLSELLENALSHARRAGRQGARVWVAGQYYPASDLVRLAVTDNGCGFLATLKSHPNLRNQTHRDAILTAIQPRVSCNRDVGLRADTENEGVGLTMVVRIARSAGGKALIVSGDAYHDPAAAGGLLRGGAFWQGVTIALELRRDRLGSIRIAELLPTLEGMARVPLRFE